MSKRRFSEPPWTMPIAVADVAEAGNRIELAADSATRAAIADLAGIPGLPQFEAQFDVTRHGREGLRVVGRVAARVEQSCVVTLEPIQNRVEESVDVVFLPPAGAGDPTQIEQTHTLDQDEPIQTLVNGTADLGALATEFLLLGIDPYPRKADAVFTAPSSEDAKARPFAALAALKKDLGEKP